MPASRFLPAAVAAAVALSGVLPATAVAQTPPDLRDLVGARGAGGETQLRSRGYEFVRAQQAGDSSYTYWTRDGRCIQVTTTDGRYASIDTMDRSNCNAGGGGHSSSGDTAAAVLAGAAIVGLAAALSHHNSKHDGHDNAAHNDDYSRGFNDGLYGAHYDSNDSEAYHSGYFAGENERTNRRASDTTNVRGATPAARDACSRRADAYQNQPPGSSVPVSAYDLGGGQWQLVMATGPYRSRCTVTADGDIRSIDPY